MKALTYHGTRDVRVETVPDPAIIAPSDILLEVTSTAICGSDLHLFRGKMPFLESGDILGHEFMGKVAAVGRAVTNLRVGQRVVIPFTISCGECFFCQKDLFAACETTNPDRGAILNKKTTRPGAALFGYTHLYGGVPGGQAEYVRVPHGDFGALPIPDALPDEKVLFLSDILPTGYQAVLNAGVGQGSSLAIFGAGPVGLMAVAAARYLGVETIYLVDHHQYRLDFAAQTWGVETLNFDHVEDPAAEIVRRTNDRGVDGSVDGVGFEAKGSAVETMLANLKLEGGSGAAVRQCIAATRRGGAVSIPGVYAGFLHGFLLGDAFDKGLTFKMGQTHAQALMPALLEAIGEGKLNPEVIISHVLPLTEAARGYEIFDAKQEACRKVILKPGLDPVGRPPVPVPSRNPVSSANEKQVL